MLGRLASFALTTGLTSVVGLISVPVIIAGAGPSLWGIQAALQTAAGLFGILVSFGWGTTGAGEIAAAPADRRPQKYVDSLVTRAYLALIAYPAMVVTMGLLNPNHLVLVAVGSATFLMPFLGASWYFIGEARPARLFWLDGFPQSIGVLAGVVVMIITHDLITVLAVQAVFNAVGVILSARTIVRSSPTALVVSYAPRESLRRLAGQRHSVMTAATSGLYVSVPLLLLNAVAPSSLSRYAMGDKLFRFGLTAFSPVLQLVQGWLPANGRSHLLVRMRLVARLVPAAGVIGAVLIALLGPIAANLLSGGEIGFTWELSIPFGLIFGAVAVTQVVGLACLVQLNETRSLARSTLAGAISGIPLIVVGALSFGAAGVAWAVALSELVVLAVQYRSMYRALAMASARA
ncbi:polysaccharide biosynthesis C-terminal domain-containing protein [Sinomonas albida]|uniref:polysaccharide biosynthesis C-terminal domain-containing protein n=1 Tax=Sinomonas albida TaxID=369942 RepID=UPI003019C1E6